MLRLVVITYAGASWNLDSPNVRKLQGREEHACAFVARRPCDDIRKGRVHIVGLLDQVLHFVHTCVAVVVDVERRPCLLNLQADAQPAMPSIHPLAELRLGCVARSIRNEFRCKLQTL
eukprot:scaffold510_cov242-Pinguiococcus_pyrenoidosus.AAC.14